MRWKPSSSHHAAIKPTPENARILSLAPPAIVGCARITFAADGFNISLTQAPTCRWAKLKRFDVGASAAGLNTDVSSFWVALPAFNYVLEVAMVFWKGGGKQKVVWFICARSNVTHQFNHHKARPRHTSCWLSNIKEKSLHLFGLWCEYK